jgi:F-type H+-transporting ATPase subunit b
MQALAIITMGAAVWMGGAASAEEAAGGNSVFAGDVGNALWTLVIFVLVLVVLGRYAWGPILRGLQAREDFIRQALETAKRERDEAEARLREYEERLAAARVEATAIVEQGRRDAEAVKKKIEEQAKVEADRMIERAKREIALAAEAAGKELYGLAARLATDIASRVIGREVKPEDHQRLIAESIEELAEEPRH